MLSYLTANTILYCQAWAATVAFYRDVLELPVTFANEWFVEFGLTESARLSIADERRATVKGVGGGGMTMALQVADVDTVWHMLAARGVEVAPIRNHPWGARVFYLRDPEGHRLEFWSPL